MENYFWEPSWYAVSTRSRQEKSAATMLQGLEIPYFLPLFEEERQWSDRKQVVTLPLFPGYIFVHIQRSLELQLRVLKVPGIVDFVSNGTGPLSIPEEEIGSVRAVVSRSVGYTPHSFAVVGNRVRVVRGPLAGLEGTVSRCGGQSRLVISIEMIQRAVSVTVAESDVEPACQVIAPKPLFERASAPQPTRSMRLPKPLMMDSH